MYKFSRLLYFLIKVYYFTDVSDNTLVQLFESINDCGPIVIKFAQWYVSIIELEHEIVAIDKIKKIMSKILEHCKIHQFNQTKKLYLQDFSSDLSTTLELNETPIASGSIGQVYHGYFGDYEVAVKVKHPNTEQNFLLYSLIIRCFAYFFMPTFEISTFLSNIKSQLDFSLESNNIEFVHNIYKNDAMIVTPKLHFYSQNFIVMSYEQGINFNQLTKQIHKYKAALSLICFQKQLSFLYGLHHGDLHKGNWKVRFEDDIQKIVVYDFGLMFKMNKKKLHAYDKYYQSQEMPKLIDEVLEGHGLKLSKNTYDELYIDLRSTLVKPPNSIDIIKTITNVLKQYKLKVDGNHLQILVSFGLIEHVVLHAKNKIFEENAGYENVYFNNCVDIISFCKTNKICYDLIKFLENDLKNVQFNILFEKQNNFMSLEDFYG